MNGNDASDVVVSAFFSLMLWIEGFVDGMLGVHTILTYISFSFAIAATQIRLALHHSSGRSTDDRSQSTEGAKNLSRESLNAHKMSVRLHSSSRIERSVM